MTHPPDPYGNAARQRGEGMSDSPNPASGAEGGSVTAWTLVLLIVVLFFVGCAFRGFR